MGRVRREARIVNAESVQVIESRISRWREFMLAQGDVDARVADTEHLLRDHVSALTDSGLDADEAVLVAIKRVAADDPTTREFARTLSDELWGAPEASKAATVTAVAAPAAIATDDATAVDTHSSSAEFWIMLAFGFAAGIVSKLPALFGIDFYEDGSFYARNLSLFVLPFLAAYFVWRGGLSRRLIAALSAVFVAGAVFANVYPFESGGSTEVLTAIHLPIVLWLAVGVAYIAGDWLAAERRLEYVRFTGEWLITYALVALGGGVLLGITAGVFGAIGLNVEPLFEQWLLPCALGAVLVTAWLVVTRRNLVGGMAPMLARVFTPLFAIMLVALLAGVVSTRGVITVEREVLILFDLLLVVVLALLLYAFSAREQGAKPGAFDWIQLVLVVCALTVDVFALVNIAARLSEFGFSANRTAALGLNLILLVNLAYSAYLQTGFVRSRREFDPIMRWQMRYLPVYALWAAIVVIAFPPLFGFA